MKKSILFYYIFASFAFTFFAIDEYTQIKDNPYNIISCFIFLLIASSEVMNVIKCTIQLYKSGKFDEQT